MAKNEFKIQGSVRGPERDGRTDAWRLPAFHDHVQLDHTKSEHAKGLPSELSSGQVGVLCSREQKCHVLPERGGGSTAASDQDDVMAELYPEHGAVRSGDVCRFVERPEAEAEAVHAFTDYRRVSSQHRFNRLRVFFLRATNGDCRYRRDDSTGRYGWSTGIDTSGVRVCGGHKHGEFMIDFTIDHILIFLLDLLNLCLHTYLHPSCTIIVDCT